MENNKYTVINTMISSEISILKCSWLIELLAIKRHVKAVPSWTIKLPCTSAGLNQNAPHFQRGSINTVVCLKSVQKGLKESHSSIF